MRQVRQQEFRELAPDFTLGKGRAGTELQNQSSPPANLLTSNHPMPTARRLGGQRLCSPLCHRAMPHEEGARSTLGSTLAQFKRPDLIIYANSRFLFAQEGPGRVTFEKLENVDDPGKPISTQRDIILCLKSQAGTEI